MQFDVRMKKFSNDPYGMLAFSAVGTRKRRGTDNPKAFFRPSTEGMRIVAQAIDSRYS